MGISERCALFYSDLKSALQETERFKGRNWTVFANHAKGNDLLDLGPDIGKVRFPSSAAEIPNILIMDTGTLPTADGGAPSPPSYRPHAQPDKPEHMGHIMKIYSEDLPKMGYKFSYTNAATNQKSLNPHALARRATLIIVLGESTTNREKGTLDPGSIKELQKFPLYALLNTVLAPERGPVVLWIGDWSDGSPIIEMVMNGNRSVPNFNAPLVDAALEKVSIKQKKEIDKDASQDAAAALEKVSVEQKEENDKEAPQDAAAATTTKKRIRRTRKKKKSKKIP